MSPSTRYEIQRIKALLKQHKRPKQIAYILGVTYWAVIKRIQRMNKCPKMSTGITGENNTSTPIIASLSDQRAE